MNLNLNFEFGPVSYRNKPEPVRTDLTGNRSNRSGYRRFGEPCYQVLVDSLSEPSHDDTFCTIVEAAVLSGRDFLDAESWEIFIRKVLDTNESWTKHLDLVLTM